MRDLTHDIATKRIANIHFFSQLSIPNFFVSYRKNKKRSETRHCVSIKMRLYFICCNNPIRI